MARPEAFPARYNAVARLLHWTIAALVIANLAIGLFHDALQGTVQLMPIHKAIGMTVLTLSLARLGWRLAWRPPAWPPAMRGRDIAAARAVHTLFYVLLLAMPLSGWIVSSAADRPLRWFGLFDIPKLAVIKSGAVYDAAHEAHELLGWLMLALSAIHIAAALRHHFILRDGMVRRML